MPWRLDNQSPRHCFCKLVDVGQYKSQGVFYALRPGPGPQNEYLTPTESTTVSFTTPSLRKG